MDPITFYGRPNPLRPASVSLVANSLYKKVRDLLRFPKKGRRVSHIRIDIRTADVGYFKNRSLAEVIGLASEPICREWWIRYVNAEGDANELRDKNVPVKIRRHRREVYWVKEEGELKCKKTAVSLYLFVKVYRQRRC